MIRGEDPNPPVIRSVIDTNILVSSLLARNGNESKVIDAVDLGYVVPCLSLPIWAQYHDVLFRPKFKSVWDLAKQLVALIERCGKIIDPAPSPVASPDPGDTIFIACAFAAKAEFIVTGNARHFPEGRYGTATVVNAATLLRRLDLPL